MSPSRPYAVPTCRCGGAGVRRRRLLFGVWRALYQCERCGKNLRGTPARPEELFSLDLYRPKRKHRPNARGRDYAAFLKSRVWIEQAKRILARDRYKCRLRYQGVCTGRAVCVHHLTYERFGGDERDDDLVSACNACNHEERRRRVTSRVLGSSASRVP